MTKTYKVGDGVWYATFEVREEKVPCPVCYGNKSVIVRLGNGDDVQVECDYCGKGLERAMGFVSEYVQLPRAEYRIITNRSIEETSEGEVVEYRSTCYLLDVNKMFTTEEEALSCAETLAITANNTKSPKYKNEKSI